MTEASISVEVRRTFGIPCLHLQKAPGGLSRLEDPNSQAMSFPVCEDAWDLESQHRKLGQLGWACSPLVGDKGSVSDIGIRWVYLVRPGVLPPSGWYMAQGHCGISFFCGEGIPQHLDQKMPPGRCHGQVGTREAGSTAGLPGEVLGSLSLKERAQGEGTQPHVYNLMGPRTSRGRACLRRRPGP